VCCGFLRDDDLDMFPILLIRKPLFEVYDGRGPKVAMHLGRFLAVSKPKGFSGLGTELTAQSRAFGLNRLATLYVR
jgi:hypothetical protein